MGEKRGIFGSSASCFRSKLWAFLSVLAHRVFPSGRNLQTRWLCFCLLGQIVDSCFLVFSSLHSLVSLGGCRVIFFFFFLSRNTASFLSLCLLFLMVPANSEKTFYQDSLSSLSSEQFFSSLCLRKCSRTCCWSQTLSDTFLLCSRYPGM